MSTSTSLLDGLLADLDAETDLLHTRVAGADDAGWTGPTDAAGWTVATQIAHLAWTDEVAVTAATDRAGWDALVLEGLADPTAFVDDGALRMAVLPRAEVMARWETAHAALGEALRAFPAGRKLPWFGPPMSPASMATARFMETWAHAQDVYAGLGQSPPAPTDRLRHVAHLGVRTRDFAFGVRGLTPPTGEFRIELDAPSGDTWVWGPEDAEQSVRGPAQDFCLLVTQRIHRDDTDLVATGPDAEQWLTIAQAFAGPPGPGRPRLVEGSAGLVEGSARLVERSRSDRRDHGDRP